MGNGVPVRNGGVVQGTVIAAGTPVTGCFLGNHMQWGSPWAGRVLDDPKLQHVIELLTGNTQTLRRQTAGTGMHRGARGGDVVLY